MNLDDLDYFKSIDSEGYLRAIDALPDQAAAAWTLGQALPLPDALRSAQHLLVIGRGDSATAGDLARAVVSAESRRPITAWAPPDLPAWVGADTLVLALSHSGETAEIVTAAETALARGAQVLAITSGGRLAALPGATVWRYPQKVDSRAAMADLALLTLALLTRLGVADDKTADVAEAVDALRRQQAALRADSAVSHNPAKRMAGQLMEHYSVLFVADALAPAGRRWQGQINQIGKAWAQCIPLAEASHAVSGMLFPEALVHKYLMLFLRGAQETPAARERMDAVRRAFMTNGFNTDAIAAVGRSVLSQLLTLSHYGDYVAYYLAMCYAVDPAAVVRL